LRILWRTPKEVAAFLNRNGLYEDAFIDDYINQLDSSNRLDHLRQGLKEGLAELERQVQEHLVEQAMSAAVGPALGAASLVTRKGVAKIAFRRLRKKSARAAGMRVTGRLTGTAGSNAAEEMARREAANVSRSPIKEGIYEFPDQTAGGKPYVGQSGNLPDRLVEHEAAGRLKPGTQVTTPVSGGKTAREIAEHNRIQGLTGGQRAKDSPKVANKVDPIGPNRRPGLGFPEPQD
jgi:hypothetical protein